MKTKIKLSVALTVAVFILSVTLSVLCKDNISYDSFESASRDVSTSDETNNTEEMRGLWVSYISLYMDESDRSFEKFKEKFDHITETALKMKCNTLVVQVRPFCDALYESDIYPASHILSGTQGVYPEYDALEYMCEKAHKRNLKIHAWINPYRVKSTTTPSQLSESNPSLREDGLTLNLESGVYLNPAKSSVRKLIIEGIREIIQNYEVDGIQFDDYFYPSDIGNADYGNYNAYIKSLNNNSATMSLEEWRQNNINLLIAETYKTIKDIDNNVVFGISPQGNIENNYTISADVKRWCEVYGYVDYICPQMYYSLDNPSLTYENCLKDWGKLTRHKSLEIYIGLGVYKAGSDEDSGTWLQRNDILAKELKLLREYGYDGYMLYDYNALISDKTKEEVNNLYSVIDNNT